jgi:hypothetical protein
MFQAVAVVAARLLVLTALTLPVLGHAQGAVAAFDLQTGCVVGSIPNAEKLSVSWTGECVSGSANGVGDVIAFSNGTLRYILRAEFRAGQLRRQENVRDCGSTNCLDDVPASMIRLHRQNADSRSASAPPPTSTPVVATNITAVAPAAPASTPVPAPASAAQTEIRAPDAVYRGSFVLDSRGGTITGEGKVEFFDGRSYQGALRAGRKVGTGTYVWADGQRYSGEWVDDVQQGRGEWSTRAGDRYQGEFKAGRREGTGTMTYANGIRYEGSWVADQENGRGKITFANGDVYEGDFVKSERTGNGTYRQKSGSTYTGQWSRGQRDGNGVEEWANGQRYEGSWKANRKDGLGLMRFPDGGTYDGDWREDRALGQGDIVFASGDVYTGQVRDGLPHGKGIFRWGSGDRFEGEFDGGKPTAKGEMTFMLDAVGPVAATAAADPAPPVAPRPTAPVVAAPEAPSRASLCSTAFNSANSAVALRRFLDSFPDDECGRHGLARQKMAAIAERERNASRATEEKAALAKTLIGAVVAFRQEFPFCVSGSGANCQRVTYVFDVKAKVQDIDVQRRVARVQISDATSLGNQKGAPPQLFAEGRSAATQDFKSRNVGGIQSKSLEEVGLAF